MKGYLLNITQRSRSNIKENTLLPDLSARIAAIRSETYNPFEPQLYEMQATVSPSSLSAEKPEGLSRRFIPEYKDEPAKQEEGIDNLKPNSLKKTNEEKKEPINPFLFPQDSRQGRSARPTHIEPAYGRSFINEKSDRHAEINALDGKKETLPPKLQKEERQTASKLKPAVPREIPFKALPETGLARDQPEKLATRSSQRENKARPSNQATPGPAWRNHAGNEFPAGPAIRTEVGRKDKVMIKKLQPPEKAVLSSRSALRKAPPEKKLVIGQIRVEVIKPNIASGQKEERGRKTIANEEAATSTKLGNGLIYKQRFGLGQL